MNRVYVLRRQWRLHHQSIHGDESSRVGIDSHEYSVKGHRSQERLRSFIIEQDQSHDLSPLYANPGLSHVHAPDLTLGEPEFLLKQNLNV